MLLKIFKLVRQTQSLPRQFNLSQGFRVHKKLVSNESDEQVGSDSRIVHSFCSLAKAYLKV
eukprot:16447757-Heterocapsa_arctica.AAC.1